MLSWLFGIKIPNGEAKLASPFGNEVPTSDFLVPKYLNGEAKIASPFGNKVPNSDF